MAWVISYVPENCPNQVKTVPALFASKEEALAAIRRRERVRSIEDAFGPAERFTGRVIWIVEWIGAAESEKLPSSVSEDELKARAHFAR